MRKILKWLIIGLGAIAVILIGMTVLYMFRMNSETKIMTPAPTGLVVDGVYSINNGFVDMFIIRGKTGYIAIDSGTDAKKLDNELKKLNIDESLVRSVFLTHTDYDHTAGLKLFKNAKVYISSAEEQMINGKTHRALIFNNSITPGYKKLKDGEEIKVDGIKVNCILTPGHTPGSMCYLVNDKYLFTGDTISLKNGIAGPFNKFFNMDTKTELSSIKKIDNLPGIEYVFTAHYGYTNNYKKAFENWNK